MPVPNLEWRFPTRLVTSGVVRKLWGSKDLERGNGLAASLLPVLALHVSPKSSNEIWTGFYRLPYLELAELAGIGHGSVGPAMKRLKRADLLDLRTRSRAGGRLTHFTKGRRKIVLYRLKAKILYPQKDEAYVTLKANLFQSGTWAGLPTAARPLYLVLRCLQESQVHHSSSEPRNCLGCLGGPSYMP
jgi:hypothetical protein